MRQESGSESARKDSSFVRLLSVWVLVGSSLCGLGWTVADAVPVALPVSSMDAGLLAGTVVVALFWVVGFRPSLSASVGYFVAEQALHLLLALGSGLFSSGALGPWREVCLRGLSVALAGALVFTGSGKRLRDCVRTRAGRLVETPPEANR
ncbi:hypothetical protein M0R89_18245 [Halorussus limi]|uniref:Uncharacterized protein n=1 Tax=Halorussus limi TaxID=2938695 RepID=A0A8U0HU47_9EURY|nr:hypothetical protein [Halorussus limi]UPV74458.1 hypothetical protein M0R89_18245 [Halorussus limi]